MTTTLTPAQQAYASTLHLMFCEDVFAGMLGEEMLRQLARGFASNVPVDRMIKSEHFTAATPPQKLNLYLEAYLARVWPYFPIAKLVTEEFKTQVLAVATAAAIRELEIAEGKGVAQATLAERLND